MPPLSDQGAAALLRLLAAAGPDRPDLDDPLEEEEQDYGTPLPPDPNWRPGVERTANFVVFVGTVN
jgi:hypothetical protein